MKQIIRHIIIKVIPYLWILIVGITSSCIETHDFESEIENFESALVVEATITDEMKQQKILLSRTFELYEEKSSPETNAVVKVVDDLNREYLFLESSAGVYLSNKEFSAEQNRSYTLSIQTGDAKVYNSTSLGINQQTKIDSLYPVRYFNEEGIEGVSIFVDSSDPTETYNYYRYEYEETYKIISPLYKPFKLIITEGGLLPDVMVVPRTEQVQICYNTVKSNAIIINRTLGLTETEVNKFSVRFLERGNYFMSHRYSILVRQYAQSNESYRFYEALKKVSEKENLLSENQNGFFAGNIHSQNNIKEKVLGYFEVSSVADKRLYFNFEDLFPEEQTRPFIDKCDDLMNPKESYGLDHHPAPDVSPLEQAIIEGMQFYDYKIPPYDETGELAPYILVRRECGDCTALGKTEIPNFWIE